jgi:N6-adenosine-specific RNA methylase IME4
MGNADLTFSPLANIFPLMEGQEFDDLVADIKAHGLHEPVVIFRGQILDGRNRYRACVAAGIEWQSIPYIGDDPLAYVISLNLKRRHLNESQRAMVAAKLATLKLGDNQHSEGPSIEGSSKLLNVGHASVERAKTVQRAGVPELIAAVERGQVSVSAAADIASQPQDEQREIVARGAKEILEAAKAIRAEQYGARHAANLAKIAEIANAGAPLPQDRRYPIILADPPWKFRVYDDSGMQRAAQAHYPTMELADICKLPVAELATPDALLFMWTTAPHLPEAFQVLAAWSFEYCTHVVWVKDKWGLGYWVRNQHELLLIATRGNFPAPKPADRPSSVISAPRREHSRKPDEAYELIERMYPELPKIELFARHARQSWAAWGNQAQADPDDLEIPRCLRRVAL